MCKPRSSAREYVHFLHAILNPKGGFRGAKDIFAVALAGNCSAIPRHCAFAVASNPQCLVSGGRQLTLSTTAGRSPRMALGGCALRPWEIWRGLHSPIVEIVILPRLACALIAAHIGGLACPIHAVANLPLQFALAIRSVERSSVQHWPPNRGPSTTARRASLWCRKRRLTSR